MSKESRGDSNGYLSFQVKILNKPVVIRRTSESTLTEGMQWKVETTTSGAYKIVPKTGEENDYVLFTSSSLDTNNVGLLQRDYTDDNDYRDEWIFEVRSNTSLEGQQWSKWCWAASARMFANHYYSNITRTQSEAVNYVKNSVVNEPGINDEAKQAIEYYIGNISGATLNLQSEFGSIYSEEVLRRFLDDGHVVYIARGSYNGTVRDGGHAVLITGYTTVSIYGMKVYKYIIYDPWPKNQPIFWNNPQITSGQTYTRTYQWICNGKNPFVGETPDEGVWDGYVTVVTSYSGESIPPALN